MQTRYNLRNGAVLALIPLAASVSVVAHADEPEPEGVDYAPLIEAAQAEVQGIVLGPVGFALLGIVVLIAAFGLVKAGVRSVRKIGG